MNWSVVAILATISFGFVGFCLMVAAFVLVARRGGWTQAMRSGPDGRWPLPKRLMFTGAFLGMFFAFVVTLLFAIPGGIPWTEGSDWTGIAVMLPTLTAVWYFIIRPAYASRHHQTEGGKR